jgi:hypothetical protein
MTGSLTPNPTDEPDSYREIFPRLCTLWENTDTTGISVHRWKARQAFAYTKDPTGKFAVPVRQCLLCLAIEYQAWNEVNSNWDHEWLPVADPNTLFEHWEPLVYKPLVLP